MSAAKQIASSLFPRREFLKAGGALVIGFSMRGFLAGDALGAQGAAVAGMNARGGVAGPPDPKQIDTWLAIHADNTATVYIGYVELGQGSTTSLLQISAEELDLDMSQVSTIRLDTNITPNQGGTYSSSSIARGSPAIRTAAAEARQALLQLASKKLGAPVERLAVSRGIVAVMGSPRSVTYGELVGDKPFSLAFTGSAPLKPVADYKLVGKSPTRNDIPDKVSGKYIYLQHVRLPGMVHGRVVRPRGQGVYGAGAKVASLDETSIAAIPGARVLRKGDFVGVVADREWDAVRAAQQLKITWDMPATLPGSDGVYDAMRAEKTTDRVVLERGDVNGAFGQAAHVASGNYHAPYQAHAGFGPNGALADVKSDSALVICSTQDVYATRNTLAGVLGLPAPKVRVQYYEGSGTYGHSCYDDVAQAAAILSQLAGKPVRLQFMRWDEHGWDNYGPAHVGEIRAAADGRRKNRRVSVRRLAPQLERHRDIRAARARHSGGGMAARRGAAGEPHRLWRHVRHPQRAARESSGAGAEISEGRVAAFTARSFVFVRIGADHRRTRASCRYGRVQSSASAISRTNDGWACSMPSRWRRSGRPAGPRRMCRTRKS